MRHGQYYSIGHREERHQGIIRHAVIQAPSNDTDTVKPAASAFASTIKTGLYPLLLVMPICTFLVIGTFNESEIRRRLYASPKRSVSLELQQVATCCMFAAGMHRLHRRDLPADDDGGVPFEGLTIANVGLSFVSLLVYTLMAIACGFLLGSVVLSEMAVNGFVNVFGLLTMFTSGMSFAVDMMPAPMIMIGKLLPDGGCACPSTTCSDSARLRTPAWTMAHGRRRSVWWRCSA